MTNDPFHFSPDLFNLLIDTIPRLVRSKPDVLLFFEGCGVPESLMHDVKLTVVSDRQRISKFDITRTILKRLNTRTDAYLGPRREVIKRVVEFEDFSSCWPTDQLKAKGLVAEVRRVVDVKDSFTRMRQERDAERRRHVAQSQAAMVVVQQRRLQLAEVQRDLLGLFAEPNSYLRGKLFESVLNRLFAVEGILIREAFTLVGDEGEGVVEQIDGVIELDSQIYVVEAKWWNEPLGPRETARHLVQVYGRGEARGLFISASGYTDAAIIEHRRALTQKVVVLCELRELVLLLEQGSAVKDFLRKKANAAMMDHNPLYHSLSPVP
jgi:restriction system protein